MLHRALSVVITSATLVACATIPRGTQDRLDVSVPDEWASVVAARAPVDSLWWQSLGDNRLDSLIHQQIRIRPAIRPSHTAAKLVQL